MGESPSASHSITIVFVFKYIETEARAGQRHLAETGRVLFQDIIAAEQADGRRILYENDTALVFMPYMEFHPPLRKPNLLKYLAGPEIGGGNFLSDTSPEEKAAELRAQPDAHYKTEQA